MEGLYPAGTGPKMIDVPSHYHLPPFNNKTDIDEPNFALKEGYQPIKINFDSQLMGQVCTNQGKQ